MTFRRDSVADEGAHPERATQQVYKDSTAAVGRGGATPLILKSAIGHDQEPVLFTFRLHNPCLCCHQLVLGPAILRISLLWSLHVAPLSTLADVCG